MPQTTHLLLGFFCLLTTVGFNRGLWWCWWLVFRWWSGPLGGLRPCCQWTDVIYGIRSLQECPVDVISKDVDHDAPCLALLCDIRVQTPALRSCAETKEHGVACCWVVFLSSAIEDVEHRASLRSTSSCLLVSSTSSVMPRRR